VFPILESEILAPDVRRLRIAAARIAKKQRPGQFVIVRLTPRGERIPLTIAGADAAAGTFTLVVQAVGKTTRLLDAMGPGDAVLDVVGPLGRPTEVRAYGHVVAIGGGVGAAIVYPGAAALKAAGNRLTAILGARSRERLVLEQELGGIADVLHVTTDDGSHGCRGFVTRPLLEMLDAGERVDHVFAAGPVPMMRAVAEASRPYGVPTVVSLNPIMIDGTGMCGGCRVLVGGESRFACVDGPEFDAHQVDYDVLLRRNAAYRDAERVADAALTGALA
jgi:ferredoxin--NADP+ reductase